jgi:hypothetical protein
MATEINVDLPRNVAYIRITGSATSQAILDAFDQAVSHPDYREGMGRLWDFTRVDLSGLESATIQSMAKYSTRFPPGIRDVKVAFVVTENMEYGLTRMFQAYSEAFADTSVRVFRTMELAESWMIQRRGE